MKAVFNIKHLGTQYVADNMSLLVQPVQLPPDEQQKLIAELRKALDAQTSTLEPPKRAEILAQAEKAIAAPPGPERESSLNTFLEMLNKGLGSTAQIVLTAVKLARVISGV